MALKKQKQLDNTGLYGEYWRLIQVNINFDRLDGRFELVMYSDQEARDGGKNPLNESISREIGAEALNSPIIVNGVPMMLKDAIKARFYAVFMAKAVAEAAKRDDDESKDTEVAFFSDAEGV